MKVKDMMLILERINPELEVYFDLGNDLDPIDKITGFQFKVILNFRR